jgi:hypothetical protein
MHRYSTCFKQPPRISMHVYLRWQSPVLWRRNVENVISNRPMKSMALGPSQVVKKTPHILWHPRSPPIERLGPWRWDRLGVPKRRLTTTNTRYVKSQKSKGPTTPRWKPESSYIPPNVPILSYQSSPRPSNRYMIHFVILPWKWHFRITALYLS